MNIGRLKKMREFIAQLPAAACDMTDYFEIAWNEETAAPFTFSLMKEHGFACGSVACLAGWTSMVAHEATPNDAKKLADSTWKGVHIDAAQYLGLTNDEADRLFTEYPDDRPEEGWKSWMLWRLDDVIARGAVPQFFMYAVDEYDDGYGDEETIEEAN